MNDRWRVERGQSIGWVVKRGGIAMASFALWHHAYKWALQQAVYEGLGIISLEITS